MELIYDDLILEIGRHLPIKALCAFICTSSKTLALAPELVINIIKADFSIDADRIKPLLAKYKSSLKVYKHYYELYQMIFGFYSERTITRTNEPQKIIQIHILTPHWGHSPPTQQAVGRVNRITDHIPKPKSVQRLTVEHNRKYMPKKQLANRNQLKRLNLRR